MEIQLRALRILSALALALAVLVAGVFLARAPAPPAAGSESARRLEPGPLHVDSRDHRFIDPARPTDANGDFPGAPERTLEATLWYPSETSGPHPLLVYSHGFMSVRSENVPLAELLASHGYVVVSMDYPLTNGRAPGGPNVADVANQPGDVRFVIDQILGWQESKPGSSGRAASGASEGTSPFAGSIDTERIGVLGLSLGGLTTELAAFHPRLRDERIRAALSIAGPSSMFDERFFASADVPFLMIAGTADAIVDYPANAAPMAAKIRRGGLLSVRGASHAGFAAFADGFPLRLLANPDALGCWALAGHLPTRREGPGPFARLGGREDGIALDASAPLPCAAGAPDEALAAGRQLMITRLAAIAFFESQFARDPAERASQQRFLEATLPHDFPEARWTPAGG